MRRSYEFKEESYIMHEKGSWDNYPSNEKYHGDSFPSVHKMLHKPSSQHSKLSSYDHHDEDGMVFNKTRWGDNHDWCGTHHLDKKIEHNAARVNYDRHGEDGMAHSGTHWDESRGWVGGHSMDDNNFSMKKHEHQVMGAKSILRPPLGSVYPPSHHQHHQYTMYEGSRQVGVNRGGRPYIHSEGSTRQSMSMMVNNSNSNNNNSNNWTEASKKFEDYNHGRSNTSNSMKASKKYEDYDARLQEELESLIKRLRESGFNGEVVHKIEVIEYERRSYGGGIMMAYPQTHSIYGD